MTETYTYKAGTTQVATLRSQAAGRDVTYSYQYDDNGNIIYISDGTNTTTYVYDSANQLIRENNQAAGQTLSWSYDNAGNIVGRGFYNYSTGDPGAPTDTFMDMHNSTHFKAKGPRPWWHYVLFWKLLKPNIVDYNVCR